MRKAAGPFTDAAEDEAFTALWHAARQQWPTDDLELAVARVLQAGAFGPYDLSALTAPTVGDACQIFAQTLVAIVGQGVVLDFAPRPAGAMGVRLFNATPVNAEASDALVLASLVERLGQQTHPHVKPTTVWLLRPAAAKGARPAWDRFFGCRVRFGAPFSQLVLGGRDWRAPLASSNAGVHRALAPLLPAANADLVESVRARARLHLGEPQTLQTIARQLGVSGRTLQRRLAVARVSLRSLVAQVRVDEARRLLAAHRRTLSEVAAQVGFASATSLARALRRAAVEGSRSKRR